MKVSRILLNATFPKRHNYLLKDPKVKEMLKVVGVKSMDELIDKTVPKSILNRKILASMPGPRTETSCLGELKALMGENAHTKKSFLGMGYYGALIPPVLVRNVLEDPGWYTAYTPYQAEISQGRLESLMNYQTMITDLTGFPMSNASLLDEGTACAESMYLCVNLSGRKMPFFVSDKVSPQNIGLVQTRAKPLGVKVIVGDVFKFDFGKTPCCGVLVQYPDVDGSVLDYSDLCKRVHKNKGKVVCVSDLLALTVLKTPAEFGADMCVGSTQRFGNPLGYGGPNAGFMSCSDELKRKIPGRIIGISKDTAEEPCFRMAIQTREQHIRREKATSNICTSSCLLANLSAFYAIYHGPQGLKEIANSVHESTVFLKDQLINLDYEIADQMFFDTIKVKVKDANTIIDNACDMGYNLRKIDDTHVGISLDETVVFDDVKGVLRAFGYDEAKQGALIFDRKNAIANSKFARKSKYLTHEVFNRYHTEHEILRYINRLRAKDYGLNNGMIPLGSCTMKLNPTACMVPITWSEVNLHPFVPKEQAKGYYKMFKELEDMLCKITGLDFCSLQPNAGSQGEYTGLSVIKKYMLDQGKNPQVVLIPSSAHGTNPASAAMLGMKIVVVNCDNKGNVDVKDLKVKLEKNKKNLCCLMITYPSTHGVFESRIQEIVKTVHSFGAQVYLDGANMNAQSGLTNPGTIGADVCHLNLHKTFAIPHGGGGPGMGPICVRKHLQPYLPNSPVVEGVGGDKSIGNVCSAPYGSASVLPISWMFIKMLGGEGVRLSTEMAILNANYMSKRLEGHYETVFKGENGMCAHEFIIDIRPFKKTAGIEAEDVAKRLADYGFHAPTMSFPIPNTLMIEPCESESKEELDRYCDALIAIRKEIKMIEDGKWDKDVNVLKMAPHTASAVISDKWDRPYSRELAAFPTDFVRKHKYWPTCGRIDGVWGDRHLLCTLKTSKKK